MAIWRYSDHADVDAVDPQAEKLADYLEKSARDLVEPAASLTLDPPAVSGHPGELLGPVTVHTNAAGATVTPPTDAATSGVRIVGKDGRPVTSASNGSELYFDVPEDAAGGSADLTVQASTTVPVGRAFASESRSQTQILAAPASRRSRRRRARPGRRRAPYRPSPPPGTAPRAAWTSPRSTRATRSSGSS